MTKLEDKLNRLAELRKRATDDDWPFPCKDDYKEAVFAAAPLLIEGFLEMYKELKAFADQAVYDDFDDCFKVGNMCACESKKTLNKLEELADAGD